MKFTKETIEILSNYSDINKSMQFNVGSKQTTVSVHRNIVAEADLGVDIPEEFAIYELSKFLGILSLVEEPEIAFDREYVIITGSGGNVFRYRTCEPRMIISWPKEKTLKLDSVDVSIDLTKETLTKISKAISIFSVAFIAIEGDGNKIYIKTLNKDDMNSSSGKWVVGETDKNFSIVINHSSLNLLSGNYVVDICKNCISRWKNKEKGVDYYVLPDKSSKFEG